MKSKSHMPSQEQIQLSQIVREASEAKRERLARFIGFMTTKLILMHKLCL